MKSLFLTIAVLVFSVPQSSSAQAKTYFDKNGKEVAKEKANYYQVVGKYFEQGGYYMIESYYMTGEKRSVTYSKSSTGKLPIGIGKHYFRNGNVRMEGLYSNGKRHEEWQFYYPNGQISTSGEYDNGNKIGVWDYWYKNGKPRLIYDYSLIQNNLNSTSPIDTVTHFGVLNYWDKNGNHKVIDGFGSYTRYHENNTVFLSGNLSNYTKDGEWRGYHDNGVLHYIETYQQGVLISGVSFDSLGNEYTYRKSKRLPTFPNGTSEFLKYLRKNLKYPKEARRAGIQGTVFISFTVNEDGKVSNVKTLKGVDSSLDWEAERVVNGSPKWIPGSNRGQTFAERQFIPVVFKN